MKTFAAAVLVSLASIATAQFDNIPSCALNCFIDPLTSDGCSGLTDFACHCQKADSLFAAVTPCVQSACPADDQATVISAVEETCASAGVTIEVPTPGATSSEVVASTEAPASSAVVTSEVPASTEAASSAYPTSAVESSVSGIPTPTGNGTAPTTGAPAPSQFTGAAAHATQAAGVLGAAALALFAL